jgi:hypothetical protein
MASGLVRRWMSHLLAYFPVRRRGKEAWMQLHCTGLHHQPRPGAGPVKKGRHRRFEEARKLKQQGPGAFLGEPRTIEEGEEPEDEFADIAKRYGVIYDDEDEDVDEGDG